MSLFNIARFKFKIRFAYSVGKIKTRHAFYSMMFISGYL
jgi:hypothetical protein